MTTLYKLDSSGKIRILNIWTEGDKIVQESGLIDGKLARSESVCISKNLGKINETTAEEQAISEMESKIAEKLKEEYFQTIEEAKNSIVILPMLAKDYKKERQKVKFPCYVQPKLDGCLCGDTMISTELGDISIKEIVENKIKCKVKTYNTSTKKIEYKDIANWMKNGRDINNHEIQWYEIEDTKGNIVKITGNHLVYLPRLKCWRRVDELNENDKILNNF